MPAMGLPAASSTRTLAGSESPGLPACVPPTLDFALGTLAKKHCENSDVLLLARCGPLMLVAVAVMNGSPQLTSGKVRLKLALQELSVVTVVDARYVWPCP